MFLLLDTLGTALWTSLLAAAGYGLGQRAVDVAGAVSHYSLWVTLVLVVAASWWARGRVRAGGWSATERPAAAERVSRLQ